MANRAKLLWASTPARSATANRSAPSPSSKTVPAALVTSPNRPFSTARPPHFSETPPAVIALPTATSVSPATAKPRLPASGTKPATSARKPATENPVAPAANSAAKV